METKRQARADLWRYVQEWLAEKEFTVRQAAFDRPKDFTTFTGRALFLAWDNQAKRFCRVD